MSTIYRWSTRVLFVSDCLTLSPEPSLIPGEDVLAKSLINCGKADQGCHPDQF